MQQTPRKKKAANNFYLFLSALAVGWMTGVSISPVIQTIVSSIVVLLVGAASILGGLTVKDTSSGQQSNLLNNIFTINLLPVALLCLGLIAGEVPGIFMRTHDTLGVYLGANRQDSIGYVHAPPSSPRQITGLYELHADQRDRILALYGDKLQRALRDLDDSLINKYLDKCQGDSSCVELIKYLVCEPQK